MSTVLDHVPHLPGHGRRTLSANERVHACAELGEGVLDVAALGVASAEESGVEDNQDPRAALEEDGGKEDADPEEYLQRGDDRHGRIVVLLDKDTNPIGPGVVGLGLGSVACGGDGRDQVGASVGGDVENRVHRVGEESHGVLRRKEPYKGEDCRARVSS